MQCFGDWILSPSSGGTYLGPIDRAGLYLWTPATTPVWGRAWLFRLSLQVEVKVMLLPTVRRPVYLNIKPICAPRLYFCFYHTIVDLLMSDALSDERMDLMFTVAAWSRRRSHSRARVSWNSRACFIVSNPGRSLVTIDGQSISMSRCQAHTRTCDQILLPVQMSEICRLSLWVALSDERSGLSFAVQSLTG
jgi:hypothetical protein